ncbi:UDP-N-acetylmuramate dehydrogenase [Helicobacter muridarum]|uniref:UDP-N-acetylenolpyruvoylglucosamine reductase n=1 Tax=Helicobacter muridarum TaxID=216 RepID=A0A099TYG2_9HELI|nr:UDP-N-acetylmuramate dehydrogenase [Helicobacter muridarum]TLE00794.1 UDP-N-acetylmuramate dehydrogenase [Helicobacter muridarum]STQ86520.1 UDP-N-acetylenolpyruvoylglucosamine reductase [Helicobacter muridarum]
MQQTAIDFKRYSSIKIGSNVLVHVIDMKDMAASLVPYNDHIASNMPIKVKANLSDCLVNAAPKLFQNLSLYIPNIFDSLDVLNTVKKQSIFSSSLVCQDKMLYIIGRANNLLVSPNASNLAVLGSSFNYISDLGEYVEMGASVNSLQAFLYFKRHNLSGLEFLRSLPGNVGALCNMNAGMKSYEMKDCISELNINGIWVNLEQASLHYRGRDSSGVIFAVRFHKLEGFRWHLLNMFSLMRKSHPNNPSCGSCFKNPLNDYAGRLLELVGLKGFRIGDVGFSQKHANFLVNLGQARFEDALALIELAKKRVYEEFGVVLECEVKICK